MLSILTINDPKGDTVPAPDEGGGKSGFRACTDSSQPELDNEALNPFKYYSCY